METQEKLKLVEKQICEDIPRLKELSEGCVVKNNDNGDLEIFLGYTTVDGFSRLVLKDLYTGSIRIGFETTLTIEESGKYDYSMIGHEIMLNDVLEWLDDEYIGGVLTNGIIGKRDDASENWTTLLNEEIDNEPVIWDLSKPYLKDQSEKLIDFLYNLIEE